MREVKFTLLNCRKSPIFNIKLQNRITCAIQLQKLDKFGSLSGFKGGLYFFEKIKEILKI